VPFVVNAAPAPNPRATGDQSVRQSADTAAPSSATIRKSMPSDYVTRSSSRTAVQPRATANPAVQSRAAAIGATANRAQMPSTQPVISRRARSATMMPAGGQVSRAATSRSAVNPAMARSATMHGGRAGTNLSRAGVARAPTPIFGDMSKMGGAYAACRETYATCMDQFCANKSDVYRRCICSEKFREFADTEDAIKTAQNMLSNFEDENLTNVSLSAAEAASQYQATEGEKAAAKFKDKSAAAKMLENIGDILSGKSKPDKGGASKILAPINFSAAMDDIWGGGDTWGSSSGPDVAEMEGKALYDEVNRQCSNMAKSACETEANLQMVRSAYGIMVVQDCNAYQKGINTMRDKVVERVREMNVALRNARLEDYRSHNSASVNECIAKVRAEILQPTACGPNWERCLDFTGNYINATTGEAIFSMNLFQLSSLINLPDLGAKPDQVTQRYLSELDAFRAKGFVKGPLDSCRDDADNVWNSFRMQALIEIAQAQDAKIKQVKDSCVATMKECYDTTSDGLKDMDDTTAQMSGALSARAAKQMCADKVAGCASLYFLPSPGNPTPRACEFAANGTITNAQSCGAAALIAFVSAVDDIKIEEGCKMALENYVQDLCQPASGATGRTWPWGCVLRGIWAEGGIVDMVIRRANDVCLDVAMEEQPYRYSYDNDSPKLMQGDKDLTDSDEYNASGAMISEVLERIIDDIEGSLISQMQKECDTVGGVWLPTLGGQTLDPTYKNNVYGGREPPTGTVGFCAENSTRLLCEVLNEQTGGSGLVTYSSAGNECVFQADYYKYRCENDMGGIWQDSNCYVQPLQ